MAYDEDGNDDVVDVILYVFKLGMSEPEPVEPPTQLALSAQEIELQKHRNDAIAEIHAKAAEIRIMRKLPPMGCQGKVKQKF